LSTGKINSKKKYSKTSFNNWKSKNNKKKNDWSVKTKCSKSSTTSNAKPLPPTIETKTPPKTNKTKALSRKPTSNPRKTSNVNLNNKTTIMTIATSMTTTQQTTTTTIKPLRTLMETNLLKKGKCLRRTILIKSSRASAEAGKLRMIIRDSGKRLESGLYKISAGKSPSKSIANVLNPKAARGFTTKATNKNTSKVRGQTMKKSITATAKKKALN
jgi:hypothetical protein